MVKVEDNNPDGTKRIPEIERTVKNWDNLPEFVRGKIVGLLTAYADLCLGPDKTA